MEFPPPSGFLEGDFKDTRARGQESCCLTFAVRHPSKKCWMAKNKESFLQCVLERANPTAGSGHRELWVTSCPELWAGRKGLAAQMAQMFSAPTSGCEAGTNPTSLQIWAVHREQGRDSLGEGLRTKVRDVAQLRVVTALQGLAELVPCEQSSGMLSAPTTGALSHKSSTPSQCGA